MTSITERPQQVEPTIATERRRGLVLAVWILAVAVAALAAWVIYDGVVESRTSVSGEIETLLDDYTAAWNDYDGDAFLALVTADYAFTIDAVATDAVTQSRYIQGTNESLEFDVEIIGESIMFGDGPWYVAQANRVTSVSNTSGSEGISIFTVMERDGTLLVRSHEWFGP